MFKFTVIPFSAVPCRQFRPPGRDIPLTVIDYTLSMCGFPDKKTRFVLIIRDMVWVATLRAEFFRNIWMVEKARKNFDEDEIEILRRIYAEGREDGEFDIDNIDLVADITHYCIKGLEVPFIYGRLGHGMNVESSKPLVAKVVYGALGKSGLKL